MSGRLSYFIAFFSLFRLLCLIVSCSKETTENQTAGSASLKPAWQASAPDSAFAFADGLMVQAGRLAEQSKFDSALAYYEKAGASYKKIAAASDGKQVWEKYLQAQSDYCNILRLQGKFDTAIPILNEDLKIGLEKTGKMNAVVAQIYDVLGVIHWQKGQYDQALEYEKEALRIRANVLPANHADMAKSYHNSAMIYMSKGRLDTALVFYQRALAIRLPTLGRYHRHTAATYNNLGLTYHTRGDLDNALKNFENALEIAFTLNNQFLVGNIYNNLAMIHSAKGDQNKAIEVYQKSLALLTAIYGPDHPDIAMRYHNIASAYQTMYDHDNALPHLRRAITMWRKNPGEKYAPLAMSYNNLGNIHLYEYGNYDSAFFYYNKALQIRLEVLGKEHADVGQALHNIGGTYLKMGQPESAITYYNRALKIFLKNPGNKSVEAGSAYKGLGDAYLRQKRFDPAFANYQKSLIALVYDFEDAGIPVNPPLDNVVSEGYLQETLTAKAQAWAQLPQQQQAARRAENLQKALATYEKLFALTEKSRRNFKTEETKLRQAIGLTETLANAIAAALELHRLTGEEAYQQKAFHYSETGRALLLLEAIQESNAKQYAGIPDSLLERERQLRLDLAFHRIQLQLEKLKSENLADYRFVHLATHGFANRATPDLSGLAFADDTSSSEDGVLYLREIYNLQLNADLVVLSACESGAGKLSKGEGLLGLARGFLYAGAKNLLVSLWQVNDASTARLMLEFYNRTLAGQPMAEALREARLQLITSEASNPKFAMPYYWAPFILIGQ